MALTVGDVVQLKSGGPRMTVTRKTEGNQYRCDWFEGLTKQYAVFPEDALEPADSDEGGRIEPSWG